MAIYTILLKRGKSSSWASKNIILQNGEPGFEIDTGKLKIGNGVSAWNDLPYIGEGQGSSLIYNASTYKSFPEFGNSDIIYRATEENKLYQWNTHGWSYEVMFSNDYISFEDLDNTLEDYATVTFTQELYNNMIALSEQEILEICK